MEEGYGGQQGASEEEFSFDKRQRLALSLLNYWLGDYLLPQNLQLTSLSHSCLIVAATSHVLPGGAAAEDNYEEDARNVEAATTFLV